MTFDDMPGREDQRRIALYADADGRHMTQPITGHGTVPLTVEKAGRTLTLRMIQHVPIVPEADVARVRRSAGVIA